MSRFRDCLAQAAEQLKDVVEIRAGRLRMQFTGLHDKNAKEIYEGDVIHIRPVPGKRAGDWENWSTNEHKPIIWDGGAFRFDGMNLYEMRGWRGYRSNLEYGVIGNIYENPELLNKT